MVRPLALTFTVLLLAASAAALQAQAPRQNNGNWEQLRAKGTVQAVRPGLLQIVTEDGEQWLLRVEPNAKDINYYADAEVDWLKPGMLVRISGKFDMQGKALAPLSAVSVVSPRTDLQPGVKVDSFGSTAGLFKVDVPKPKTPQPQTVSLTAVGSLKALKNGEFLVAAPGAMLHGELSDKAQVSVDLAHLNLVRVGDSIECNGRYPRGMKGQAMVSRVTIRAKEKLQAWKKPAPKPKTVKPGDLAKDPLNEIP